MRSPSSKLIDWVRSVLVSDSYKIEAVRKEASERDFYRIKTDTDTFILMDSSTDINSATRFLYVAKLFKSGNINCPAIYAFSDNLSYILMEDLGDKLLDQIKIQDVDAFFEKILGELNKIYRLPKETLTKITEAELLSQTESFLDVFSYKDIELTNGERQEILKLRKSLVSQLASQPLIPSHSDFERRNMIEFNDEIFLIDFQDLHLGPLGIDLASLFFDHENEYDEKAIKKSIKRLLDENAFIEKDLVYKYIYIALAHRCMRIIGTFTNYFKNKKLLNRRNDLENFLQRLGFSLGKLNYRKEKKLLEKLL